MKQFLLYPQIMKYVKNILSDKLFSILMKLTIYGHFVAGEDEIKILPRVER